MASLNSIIFEVHNWSNPDGFILFHRLKPKQWFCFSFTNTRCVWQCSCLKRSLASVMFSFGSWFIHPKLRFLSIAKHKRIIVRARACGVFCNRFDIRYIRKSRKTNISGFFSQNLAAIARNSASACPYREKSQIRMFSCIFIEQNKGVF